MRPILFEIPATPALGWMALLAVFLGLSAYWAIRDTAGEKLSPEGRRRQNLGTLAYNALFLAIGAALLWRFREQVAHPLPVRAYGFLLMLAFAAGLLCLQRVARGTLLPPEGAVDLILGLLLVGVVSARLLYVLLQWHTYGGNWREWFRVWEGGLSFHGGLAGGIAWVVWFAWRRGLRFWWLADLMGPSLALGYAVARIGCFLNGCCYGIPTHLPWGVRFADPPLSQHLTAPSHPVQIYASLANLAIFGILLRCLRHKRYDGQIVGLYLVLYSVYRFLAEALRKGVTGDVLALGMTEAQWASLAIAGLGLALMAWLRRQPAAAPAGDGATGRRGDAETGRRGDGETRRRGDGETGRRGDAETRRRGDAETRRRGDAATRRRGDAETRRRGDGETRRPGNTAAGRRGRRSGSGSEEGQEAALAGQVVLPWVALGLGLVVGLGLGCEPGRRHQFDDEA